MSGEPDWPSYRTQDVCFSAPIFPGVCTNLFDLMWKDLHRPQLFLRIYVEKFQDWRAYMPSWSKLTKIFGEDA